MVTSIGNNYGEKTGKMPLADAVAPKGPNLHPVTSHQENRQERTHINTPCNLVIVPPRFFRGMFLSGGISGISAGKVDSGLGSILRTAVELSAGRIVS